MKRITLSLLIAIMALTSMNCVAEKSKTTATVTSSSENLAASAEDIPFDKLLELIETAGHFDEANLVDLGLDQLISEEYSFSDDDEEGLEGAVEGDVSSMLYYVYAKNATATQVEGEHGQELRLTSTGPHSYGFEIHLDTDNGTKLYFKEKADHDTFLERLRKSSKYSTYKHDRGVTEYIGEGLLENDEYVDGWYVLDFHY